MVVSKTPSNKERHKTWDWASRLRSITQHYQRVITMQLSWLGLLLACELRAPSDTISEATIWPPCMRPAVADKLSTRQRDEISVTPAAMDRHVIMRPPSVLEQVELETQDLLCRFDWHGLLLAGTDR